MSRNVLQHPAQRLPEPQGKAIELLLNGTRPNRIAAELKVDRSTVWRWQQCPVFQAVLARYRVEAHRSACDALVDLTSDAVCLIGKLINDESVPPKIRLAAARDVLERAVPPAASLVAHQHSGWNLEHLSDEELDQLRRLLEKLERR